MTNIKIVDVVFEGNGYMMEAATKDSGTVVYRSKGVYCSPRACGKRISRGAYYLYLRGEGRMCCPCAIRLGALERVDDDRSWELTQDLSTVPF